MLSIYALLPFCLILMLVYRSRPWGKSRVPHGLKELPGPKGKLLVGNLFDVAKIKTYIRFKELADVYGPIYKLNIFGLTHVIISEQHIAEELLSMKGAFYSDRGQLHMVDLVTHGGDLLAASSEGSYWPRGRKFAAAMLTAVKAATWEPYQVLESRKMVIDMVRDPERYAFWFDRYATSVSLRETYGKEMKTSEEEVFHTNKIVQRMHDIERVATPGGYLVELIPTLLYLPTFLAAFKREAAALHLSESKYFKELFEETRQKYQNGIDESPASFARSWLTKGDNWNLSQPEIEYVLGTMYGGGSGTTANAMQSFILALCHYPEWQTKLQQELDQVIGAERLPNFTDMPQLPCVRAIAKEVLRWTPVVPGNLPHRLIKDDVYNGYHIPKGAIVHGNQWAIHREEKLYPDAEVFNPDRWLNPKYPTYKLPLEQYPNIKRYSAFGFGRRICPGLETAERSLYIQIAILGWACSVSKKNDTTGAEIPVPWYDYSEGSNVAPNPFKFDLRCRSQARIEILQRSIESSALG